MSRLYNRTFKIGFAATIATFTVLNTISYLVAVRLYDGLMKQPIEHLPLPRFPDWGVPFSWEGSSHPMGAARGLVLNFVAIVLCAFLCGLFLRWLRR